MSIVGPNGQPVQKKFDDMTIDEKLDVLRQGIGIIMKNMEFINHNLETIINAIEQAAEENTDGKPEGRESQASGVEVRPE